MIVVIGSPVAGRGSPGANPGIAGLAAQIAVAAAGAERTVQLVGRVGDDDAGDALLLALGASRVGHAALLRDAAHATPTAPERPERSGESLDEAVTGDDADGDDAGRPPAGLPLDAADVELALRYLTEFRVLVIAAQVDDAVVAAAMDAATFSGAHVIQVAVSDDPARVAAPGSASPDLTAFRAPARDEPAFAVMVGRYAAGIDAGRSPRDAFEDATRGANWERAAS